jgi:hypothetical protein
MSKQRDIQIIAEYSLGSIAMAYLEETKGSLV